MKTHWIVIPAAITILICAGLYGSRLFAIPSLTVHFDKHSAPAGAQLKTSVFLVDGVRCVDTAQTAASALNDLPDVLNVTAYASRNRLDIEYNPEKITSAEIKSALEGPIFDETAGEFQFNLYKVLEIDNVRTAH